MKEKFCQVIEKYKELTKKECYSISIEDGEPGILDDKIGGTPYLPVGEEYPKDSSGECMPLLLQVNLKNIDLEGYPKKGILEIYTDKDLRYPCEYAVRYFEDNLQYQESFPDIDLSNYIFNKSFKISLEKDFCHMPFTDYRFTDVICPIINEVFGVETKNNADIDKLFEGFDWIDLFFENTRRIPITLGGYADFTQTDPRVYSNPELEECLFKLDSEFDYDTFSVGDSGIMFVLISKQNLENVEFDKAVVDWDCC